MIGSARNAGKMPKVLTPKILMPKLPRIRKISKVPKTLKMLKTLKIR